MIKEVGLEFGSEFVRHTLLAVDHVVDDTEEPDKVEDEAKDAEERRPGALPFLQDRPSALPLGVSLEIGNVIVVGLVMLGWYCYQEAEKEAE